MLSSAIKIDDFVLKKELFLSDENSWKEEGNLFLFKVIFKKICFTKFLSEIYQELLNTT